MTLSTLACPIRSAHPEARAHLKIGCSISSISEAICRNDEAEVDPLLRATYLEENPAEMRAYLALGGDSPNHAQETIYVSRCRALRAGAVTNR